MKRGFTLAEALITMAIIGIIAALILPAINGIRPDNMKARYLQTFDSLQETILAFAQNTNEYEITGEFSNNAGEAINYGFIHNPLMNTHESNRSAVTLPDGNHHPNGDAKLCQLLAWAYDTVCDNSNNRLITDYNADNPMDSIWISQDNPSDNVVFTTKTGIDFFMAQAPFSYRNIGVHDSEFRVNIVTDLNGANNGPNCLYDSNNCTSPDRFLFFVTADGNVHPADIMGKNYVRTRSKNLFQNNSGNPAGQNSTWVLNDPDDNRVDYRVTLEAPNEATVPANE